jgi:hypothetical protein
MANLDLQLRCEIYATWFTPAVAKTLLKTVSAYTKPEAMMRSSHLHYIQALFAGVCDPHIMYQESDAGEETIGMKVDRRYLHATLRGIPRSYEGAACFARHAFVKSLMVCSKNIIALLQAA